MSLDTLNIKSNEVRSSLCRACFMPSWAGASVGTRLTHMSNAKRPATTSSRIQQSAINKHEHCSSATTPRRICCFDSDWRCSRSACLYSTTLRSVCSSLILIYLHARKSSIKWCFVTKTQINIRISSKHRPHTKHNQNCTILFIITLLSIPIDRQHQY